MYTKTVHTLFCASTYYNIVLNGSDLGTNTGKWGQAPGRHQPNKFIQFHI